MGTSEPTKISTIVLVFTVSAICSAIALFLGSGITYSSLREQPWRSPESILATNRASTLLDTGIPDSVILSYSECGPICNIKCSVCIVEHSTPMVRKIYIQEIKSLEGSWRGTEAHLQIQDPYQMSIEGATHTETWGDSQKVETKKVNTWITVQLPAFDPQYYHQIITGEAFLRVTYPTPAGYGGLFHDASTIMDRLIQFYVVSPEEKVLLYELFPRGGMGYFGLVLGPALIILGVWVFFHLSKDVRKELADRRRVTG